MTLVTTPVSQRTTSAKHEDISSYLVRNFEFFISDIYRIQIAIRLSDIRTFSRQIILNHTLSMDHLLFYLFISRAEVSLVRGCNISDIGNLITDILQLFLVNWNIPRSNPLWLVAAPPPLLISILFIKCTRCTWAVLGQHGILTRAPGPRFIYQSDSLSLKNITPYLPTYLPTYLQLCVKLGL